MKKSQNPSVVREIKKEYLMQHLEEVKKLIENWIPELRAPLPFDQEQRSGWEVVYSPASELNPDLNHMLRHHLKSRTLWNHHTNWQRSLENIFKLTSEIRTSAEKALSDTHLPKNRRYTEDYLSMALWWSFVITTKKPFQLFYNIPKSRLGVAIGAYLIEASVSTTEEQNVVIEEHKEFTHEIARTDNMIELAAEWSQVKGLDAKMDLLVNKTVKSRDILYSCQFCKHLWK